jgi:hypothetical protein
MDKEEIGAAVAMAVVGWILVVVLFINHCALTVECDRAKTQRDRCIGLIRAWRTMSVKRTDDTTQPIDLKDVLAEPNL